MTFLVNEALLHPLKPNADGRVADRSGELYRFTTDDIRHGVRPMGPPTPSQLTPAEPFDTFGPVTPAKKDKSSPLQRMAKAAGSEDATFAPRPMPPASPRRAAAYGQGQATPESAETSHEWRARDSASQLQLRRGSNHASLLLREVCSGLTINDYGASEAAHVKAQLQHVLGARQLDPRAMLFHTRLPDPPADNAPV